MEFPQRKPNRLKNFDYSQNGAYFVTICVKDRHEILWNVDAHTVCPCNICHLSDYGKAIDNAINEISEHYAFVLVDKFVIMPNHIHLIILLQGNNNRTMPTPTISQIIKQMKENVTRHIGFSMWQRSFHDHIIRSEQEYQKIWQYIDTNPLHWQEDCFYEKETTIL